MEDLSSVKGRIFDIQRFSVHDGKGIRTIVFLKGCPLRCKWCCNPESQKYEIQTMVMGGKTKTVGRDVTVGEVMKEVERDRAYFRRSGGGLTLSGGESLMQPEFATALLKSAKNAGLTTAMESTAFADFSVIERYLPYLDTYLMDIKHTNQEKHKQFTGKPNGLALENARKVALSGQTNLVIRVPVVPTFNDSVEEIKSIASFASTLPGVKKIHLLPYHRLGQDKYDWLGREYKLPEILPPEPEHMELLKKAVHSVCDLDCQIGG